MDNIFSSTGKLPGSNDLSDPTPSSTPISDKVQILPSDLKDTITNGDVVYVTVRCQNKAGLVIEESSNGVVVLISGPNAQSAVLRVLPLNVSHYATRDTTQYMTNTSLVAIEGFYDPIEVTTYQVCVMILNLLEISKCN